MHTHKHIYRPQLKIILVKRRILPTFRSSNPAPTLHIACWFFNVVLEVVILALSNAPNQSCKSRYCWSTELMLFRHFKNQITNISTYSSSVNYDGNDATHLDCFVGPSSHLNYLLNFKQFILNFTNFFYIVMFYL